MRVRLLRALTGEVDGQDLTAFQPNLIYEVPTGLGTYLIAIEGADLAFDESADLQAVPVKGPRRLAARLSHSSGIAADRSMGHHATRQKRTKAGPSRRPRRSFARRHGIK